MCPVCLANAALIAGSATSTGGLAAIAIRKFGVKSAVDDPSTPIASSCFEERAELEK